MDKTEARARIADLHAELRKLEEIVNASGALLTGEGYYIAGGSSEGFMIANGIRGGEFDGNSFPTREIAEHYAKALNTMLLLRHQPCTVKAGDATLQYSIRLSSSVNPLIFAVNRLFLEVNRLSGLSSKLTEISPCFETEAAAKKAIEFVGEDNIIHMFKTLHGLNA